MLYDDDFSNNPLVEQLGIPNIAEGGLPGAEAFVEGGYLGAGASEAILKKRNFGSSHMEEIADGEEDDIVREGLTKRQCR